MQEYIRQARHNLRLYADLCNKHPDEYDDWKITLLFYTALHWVRALADKRQIYIGKSHAEIERSCNPKLCGAMPINTKAWEHYHDLHKGSQVARYKGIIDIESFRKEQRINLANCKPGIEYLRKYIQGRGIEL